MMHRLTELTIGLGFIACAALVTAALASVWRLSMHATTIARQGAEAGWLHEPLSDTGLIHRPLALGTAIGVAFIAMATAVAVRRLSATVHDPRR